VITLLLIARNRFFGQRVDLHGFVAVLGFFDHH
jgi:hypothetical protein